MKSRPVISSVGCILFILWTSSPVQCRVVADLDQDALTDNTLKRESQGGAQMKKRATALRDRLWTDGVVPFEIAEGQFTRHQIDEIRESINAWTQTTCVTFRDKHRRDRFYVRFQKTGAGCSAVVGMSTPGQEIRLSDTCFKKRGIIMHEIGHALGLKHEHQRPDRENYIRIIWDNVGDLARYLKTDDPDRLNMETNIPYDYLSIMHYDARAYSQTEGISIQTLDPRYQDLIGQREGLSYYDIKTVKEIYNCP